MASTLQSMLNPCFVGTLGVYPIIEKHTPYSFLEYCFHPTLKATAVEQLSTIFDYLLIVVELNQQRKQELISFTPVARALACQNSNPPLCVAAEQTSFLSRPATAALKQEVSPSQVPRLELLCKVIFFFSLHLLLQSIVRGIHCRGLADGVDGADNVPGNWLATFHQSAVSICLLILRLFDLIHLAWLALLGLLFLPCGFRGSTHTQLLGLHPPQPWLSLTLGLDQCCHSQVCCSL
jgi:hypothetical protein